MEDRRSRVRAKRTPREYFSDKVSGVLGSWTFVLVQLGFIICYILLNSILTKPFDPFPYSILSSLLQIEGALCASFILLSSNRQSELDSKRLNEDLNIAKHMKTEIDEIKEKIKC